MEEELKEYIKNNFLNEDLTYKYINSKNIIKQHNEFYTVLIKSKYWDENLTMGEIFYKIIYNIDKNKCVISECNNSTNFISFNKGYLKCCSHKCNVKQGKITKLERYGDENYNNSKKSIETKIQNDSYTKMAASHRKTCKEKYGVEHHWQVPEINAKRNETFNLKYGVDYPTQNKEIRNKGKATSLEKYGFDNPAKNSDIKIKAIQNRNASTLEKLGVIHYLQSSNYDSTKHIRGYKWKEYILPSGKIIKYQGYENQLLDELLLEYHEDEILTSRSDMPEFWYIGLDNKKHRYFPDVYIPKTNTIYEVKSEWTLNVNFETNQLKFNSVRDAGYNLKIMIYKS